MLQKRTLFQEACLGAVAFTAGTALIAAFGAYLACNRGWRSESSLVVIKIFYELPRVFYADVSNHSLFFFAALMLWPFVFGFSATFALCMVLRLVRREFHYHLGPLYLGMVASFSAAAIYAAYRHHLFNDGVRSVFYGAIVQLLLTPLLIYLFECALYEPPEDQLGPIRFGVEPREPAEETDDKR